MRKAKIVCTIGPSSESPSILEQLIERGMDAARLNFSHGSHESHGRAIKALRDTASRRRAAVAIIQDLQGPRIRVGQLQAEGITVAPHQLVRLVGEPSTFDPRGGIHFGARSVAPSYAADIPVSYARLAQDIRPAAQVLIDDGLIELAVTRVTGNVVECSVVKGGRIRSHKGINLPGTSISLPTLTEKDREDIRFGVAQGVDYVALSFVRRPDDVAAAKAWIAECGGDAPVIAKIERAEAVTCLESLLDAADGVMIARGDLGVEMEPEAVPILQKRIIGEANRRRRLVITATQMLESMTQYPRPTRAEASDVANAIFDGTDAVMLSAETSVGQYPLEAVHFMNRIVKAAEEAPELRILAQENSERRERSAVEALCQASSSAAAEVGASAIVAFSGSGTTARLLSKQRPTAPIIAFTPFEPVRQRMALYWGVLPFTMPSISQTEQRVVEAEQRLKAEGIVSGGERIVILSGTQPGQRGSTNVMKLHQVM